MVTDTARPSNESDRLYTSSSPALAWIASHARSDRTGSAATSPVLDLSPGLASPEAPTRAAPSGLAAGERASLGLGLDMDTDLSRPLPSLPSAARLYDPAAGSTVRSVTRETEALPTARQVPVPSAMFSPGPWDLTDSFVQSSAPPPRRATAPPLPVYGYTGLAWEHQLDMEVATAYVIRTIERIRALGVDAPLLLSSMAVDLSASDSMRLIRTVVESLHAPSAEADRALDQELQFASVYSLVALLKWVLARIGRVVAERAPGQSGQPLVLVQERGFMPWPSYLSWRSQERQQGCPTSAYLTLTHMLETRVARLLDVLMDFFALVATHSSQNQMTPSRIGRHMGVLLFGLPEDASFADTYAWYVQASNATEHVLVAFMRYHVSVATQSTYLPRRLLRLIDDYPRMLSPDLDGSSAVVRTVPATYTARHVQQYSKDLLQRSAWPAAIASMELGPETRKQLNLMPGHVPRPGSSLQSPDVGNETADGLGTPSMQRWHEFAFEGFDDLDTSALAFDLRESDRRQRMQRVESMHWFQFEERGFHQGADDNSRWDWVMRLDEPLHDRSESALQRSESAGFDGPAPPFPYRPEPHVADTVIDEMFPEVWADYLVGNGWSNRDERVHREASFAVLQLRTPSASDNRAPGTTAWFVIEEVVPASYREALNASLSPARRSRPMLRKLNQFRMVRAGEAPESIVAVLYRFPPDANVAPASTEPSAPVNPPPPASVPKEEAAPVPSQATPSYTVPAPGPRPEPAKHATVLPPRTIPPKAHDGRPVAPSPDGSRPRPNRKSVPPGLQAKAAEANAQASPSVPPPELAPAPAAAPTQPQPEEPPLNKKRSIQRILSSLGSPRSSDSPRMMRTPFSPRMSSTEAEGETPERVPRILSGIRKRSSQWLLKGKQSLRSMRSVSGDTDEPTEASSPRLRNGFARFVQHVSPKTQHAEAPPSVPVETPPSVPAEAPRPAEMLAEAPVEAPVEASPMLGEVPSEPPMEIPADMLSHAPAEVPRDEPIDEMRDRPSEVLSNVPAEAPQETRTQAPAPGSPPMEPLPASPLQTLPPLAQSSPIHLSSPETSPLLSSGPQPLSRRSAAEPGPGGQPETVSGVRLVPRPSFERKKGGKNAELPPVPPTEAGSAPASRPTEVQRTMPSERALSPPGTSLSATSSPAMSLPYSPASSYGSSSPAVGAGSSAPLPGGWGWSASPAMQTAVSPVPSASTASPVAPPMSWTKPVPASFSSSAAAYLSSPESTASEFDDARSSGPGMSDTEAPRPAPALTMGLEEVERPPYRLSRISERSEDDVTRSLAHGTTDSHAQLLPSSSSRTLTESEGETPVESERGTAAHGLGLRATGALDAELPDIPEHQSTNEPDGRNTPAVETQSTGTHYTHAHDVWAEEDEATSVPAAQTPTFRTLDLPEVTPDRAQPVRPSAPWSVAHASGLPPYLMRSASGPWPAVASTGTAPALAESPDRSRTSVPPASVTRSPRMDKLPVVPDPPSPPTRVPVSEVPDTEPDTSVQELREPPPSVPDDEGDVDVIPTMRTSLTSTVSRISLRTDTSMEAISSPGRGAGPPRASTPKDEVLQQNASSHSPFLAGFGRRPTMPQEVPATPLPSKPSAASMPAVASVEDVSHITVNGHTDAASSLSLAPRAHTDKVASTPLAGFVPRRLEGSSLVHQGAQHTEEPKPEAGAEPEVAEPARISTKMTPVAAEPAPEAPEPAPEAPEPVPSAPIPDAHDTEKPVAQAPRSGSTITLRQRRVSKPVVSESADHDPADTSLPGEFPV